MSADLLKQYSFFSTSNTHTITKPDDPSPQSTRLWRDYCTRSCFIMTNEENSVISECRSFPFPPGSKKVSVRKVQTNGGAISIWTVPDLILCRDTLCQVLQLYHGLCSRHLGFGKSCLGVYSQTNGSCPYTGARSAVLRRILERG
jgi:hypothetical protein